ncbi:gamma-glutamylcyclotransferase family protein [Mucilaginibacter lacusdianchii]|uniref:gamma-glutamylcyclotransferase family protein n=1 Tax=Mucilaginibacter lacusdianchii TaxID=2684211 RepID=UPI00131DB4DD|nr:gamma-glutamylcyclotransferase family protein [Mucilaginibacter sp. JXJ CY 39]
MAYLFVYGTLLREIGHEVVQAIAANLEFGDQGHLSGELYDLGDYPALIETSSPAETVKGEVYMVTDPNRVFGMLDEYEGVNDEPALYSRELKTVTLANGGEVESWVYIYQQPLGAENEKIINGDYLAFLRNKVNNG